MGQAEGYFWTGMGPKSTRTQAVWTSLERRSSRVWDFFTWQKGCENRQSAPNKGSTAPAESPHDWSGPHLEGRRPTMTRIEGERLAPFEIVEPKEWRAPIIFNSPHSGSAYPDAFLNASRIDLATLRRSEDSFMDELIGDLGAA